MRKNPNKDASSDAAPEEPKEEWVRVDEHGNTLEDQNPSAEEVLAKQIAANRTHAEALGDVWAVISGQVPSPNLIGQVVATVIHEGGTRPSWQWTSSDKDYVLLAWPEDQPIRASVLMTGDKGGKLVPVSSAPLLEGLPNDLTVEDVHPWANAVDADVAVNMIDGKNPMWFYDPLYSRDRNDITPGITHTFLLSALALAMRKTVLDEVTISQGPAWEVHAQAWLADNPDKKRVDVPPLKINVHNKHLIMPGRHFCEYQIRGVVEKLEACQLDKMPMKVVYLTFPFDKRPAMRLPVYASKMVLGNYEPAIGDEIDAYVWLQGRVIDMEKNSQAEESGVQSSSR